MKKLLLSLVALLGVMNANAQVTETDLSGFDYAFYSPEMTVLAGSEVVIPIYMKNAKTVASFQFQMTLPEGIELKKTNDLNAARYDASSDSYMGTVFGSNPQPDGSTMIIGTVVEDKGFTVDDDIIGYVTISVPANFAAGEYPIVYTKENFSGVDNGQAADILINEEITSKLVIVSTLVLDENSEKLPVLQDGMTTTVQLDRTIKAGQWSTVVLPFNLSRNNANALFGSDATYAKFTKVVTTYEDEDDIPDGIEIQFESFTVPRAGISAGDLFLVKTSADIESKTLVDVTLSNVITELSGKDNEGSPYKVTGSFTKTKVPADALFISNNKFYYSKGDTNIKGFRTWFELDAVLGKETPFGVKMFIDGLPTNINDINFVNAAEGVFTIDGKKMNNDVTKLPKGVYIIDGKKVAIK